jgi:hypothetical protein
VAGVVLWALPPSTPYVGHPPEAIGWVCEMLVCVTLALSIAERLRRSGAVRDPTIVEIGPAIVGVAGQATSAVVVEVRNPSPTPIQVTSVALEISGPGPGSRIHNLTVGPAGAISSGVDSCQRLRPHLDRTGALADARRQLGRTGGGLGCPPSCITALAATDLGRLASGVDHPAVAS